MSKKEEMVDLFRQAIVSRLDRLQGHLDQLKEYAEEEWDDTEGIRRKVKDIDELLPDISRYAFKLEDAIYEAEQVKIKA